VTSKCLFVFTDNMFSKISKVELVERTRKMRAAASMNKESLLHKWKASTGVAQVQSDQHEQTTSSLVFKRKRLEVAPLIKHSQTNG